MTKIQLAAILAAFTAGSVHAQAPVVSSRDGGNVSQGRSVVQQRGPALENRVRRLEKVMASQGLLEMLERTEQLQQEVQSLRAELEEKNNELERMKRRQRDLYLDIDRRIGQLERGGVRASAPAPAVSAAPSAPAAAVELPAQVNRQAAAPAAVSVDPAKEQAMYQSAFDLLKEGRYQESVKAFLAFRAAYPNSGLTGNAQYWLGEAYYVTRDFDNALLEFQKIMDLAPNSNKVPDALLKIGYLHYETGRFADARKALESLKQDYPSSTAARLADRRLARMRKEGR